MTTVIAIETPTGVTLGWDTQITHGARRVGGGPKVFVNNGVVVGCSGDVLDHNIIQYANLPDPATADWDIDCYMSRDLLPAILAALNKREAAEKHSSKAQSNSMAIIVVRGRAYMISDDLSWYRVESGHYAIGSGSYFALGALAHGATIPEALAIATSLDVYTGAEHFTSTYDDLVAGRPATRSGGPA